MHTTATELFVLYQVWVGTGTDRVAEPDQQGSAFTCVAGFKSRSVFRIRVNAGVDIALTLKAKNLNTFSSSCFFLLHILKFFSRENCLSKNCTNIKTPLKYFLQKNGVL
jgi:hypothetical protein